MDLSTYDTLTLDDKKHAIIHSMESARDQTNEMATSERADQAAQLIAHCTALDIKMANLAGGVGIDVQNQMMWAVLEHLEAEPHEIIMNLVAKLRQEIKSRLPALLAELDLLPLGGL